MEKLHAEADESGQGLRRGAVDPQQQKRQLKLLVHPALICMPYRDRPGELFFFQAEARIRDATVTGVQTCALPILDGVHLPPHAPVDIAALGADFYACSPYKFCGPHLGVLAAAPELLGTLYPDKLLASPDTVPERFEFGTLP